MPNGDLSVVDVLSLPLSGGDIIYFEDPLVAQKQNRVPSAMIFQAPPVAPPVPKEVPRQRQVRAPQGASFKVGAEDVLVRDEAGNFVQGYWRITDIEGDRITLTDKSLSPGRTITVDVKTLESWQRVTTMTIERGELFVAGDKTKYAGRLEFFKDTDGTNKVLLTDEKNGRRTTFLFKNVTSYRPRGEDLTTQFIRVPDPQFGDKSVNKSGLKGEGQWVLVDFADLRLVQFLKTNMDPIYADLQSGSVTPEEAAIAANDAIIANVRFDEFGETPDDLVNLAKFLDQGVCNEMSMLLQVSLQYLGVGSRMEKGPFGEGRHAWVRLTDPRASPLVLDPAMKRVTAPSDARHYERYVDDETPFAQRGMKTVAVLHSSPEEAIPPEAWSKKDSENTESGPAPTEMPEKIEALPVEKTESIPKWEVGELTVRGGGLPLEFGPRPDEAVVVGAKMLGSPERTEVGEKITVEVEGEISEVALEKPPPEGTAPMIKPHRASGAEPAKRAVASASSIEKPQAVERDSPFVAFLRGAGRLFGQVRKGLFPQRLPERPPDELPKIPATKGPKPVLEAEFSDEYTDDIIATTRRSGPRDAEANRAMLNDVSRRQQLETAATALRQAGLSARLAEQTGIPARDITALYRTPLNRALVTEHSLFHFKDGTLSVTKGGLNSTESVLLEAGDETSALAGAVRELDFTAHLHLGEPRPSDEDFGIVMARARLNPGEAQRHTVFGTIDGEPAFVQLAVIHENGGIKTSLTASDNISDDSLAEIDMSARRMARLIESKSGEEALEAAFHPAAMAPKVTVDHYRQELDGLADSEALDDLMKRSMPDAERTKVMIEWHSLWQNYVIDRYPEIDEAVNAFERGLFKSDKSTQARPLNRQIRDFRDSCDFLSGGMGMSPAEITKVFKGDYGPPARFIEGIGFLKEHGISNEDIKAVMTNPATMTDLANSATKAEKGAEVVKDIHRQILAGARDPVNGQFVSSMYATQTRLLLDVANIAATFNDPAYAEQFIRGQQGLILNPALDDAVKRRQIQASLSQPHVINDFLIRSMGRYADILEGVGNNSARTYLDGLRTGISHGDARSKDLAMDFIMSANAIREGRLKAVLKNPHWDAALLETFFREAAYSAQSHGGKSPDFLKRVAANIAQQDARGGFALQNRGTIEGYLLELEIFNLIAGHGKLISTPDGGNLLPSQIPAKIDYQVSDVADPSLVGIEYRDPVTGTTLTSPLDMDVIVDSNPPLEYVEVKRTVRGGDDKQNRQREKIRMATKLKLTEKPGCITTGIDPRFAQQLIRDGTYEYVVVIGLNPATRQYQIVDVYGNNPRIGNEPVHTGDTFAPAPHIGIGNFPYTL
ncbi:MAG: hypothetical protein HYU99_05330 [Deltaproteobacteria bacterium]|nr:hypothetical protein [Deltaproteobacteria bacterium]